MTSGTSTSLPAALRAIIPTSILLISLVLGAAGTSSAEGGREHPSDITFSGAGTDVSFSESVQKGSTLVRASVDLAGLQSGAGSGSVLFDYGGVNVAHKAWHGSTGWVNGPPSGYQTNAFSNLNVTAIAASDDSLTVSTHPVAGNPNPGGGISAYHHFQFQLSGLPGGISRLTPHWEGYGFSYIPAMNMTGCAAPSGAGMSRQSSGNGGGVSLFMYNFTSAMWDFIGNYFTMDPDLDNDGVCDQYAIDKNITSNSADYVDAGNKVEIVLLGPMAYNIDGTESSTIATDYVSLDVGWYTVASFPTNPSLDVGNDGDQEWSWSGGFSTTATANITTELQSLIDAQTGTGTFGAVFAFRSGSAGIISVRSVTIEYLVPVDSPPVWRAWPTDAGFVEDGSGTALIDLLAYVSDDAGASGLTFTITHEEDPAHLDARLNANGHSLDFIPAGNWWGVRSFKVTARDAGGAASESGVLQIQVTPVNDPPVLDPIVDQAVTVGETLEFTAHATDVDQDLDQGETVTYSDNSAFFDIAPATGLVRYDAVEADVGSHSVRILATDGRATVWQDVTIVVEALVDPSNGAPTISPIPDQTVQVGAILSYAPTASDPDGDPLSFSDNSPVLQVDAASGRFTFMPVETQIGVHAVTITVADPAGLKASARFDITVTPVSPPNRPPEGAIQFGHGVNTAVAGTPLTVQATAVDPDGDPLTYTWKVNGQVVGTGQQVDIVGLAPGSYTLLLEISDGEETVTKTAPFSITAAKPKKKGKTPGFDAAVLLGAIAVGMVLLGRQRRQPDSG